MSRRRTQADQDRIIAEVRARNERPPSTEPPPNTMAVTPHQPVCVVSYRDRNGVAWAHNTQAASVFEACKDAIEWFAHGHGRALPPTDDTIFEVTTGLKPDKWHVRVSRVREWMRDRGTQAPLFDRRPEAL